MQKSGKAIANGCKSDTWDLDTLIQGIYIRIINTWKSLERCDTLCHNLSEKRFIAKLIYVLWSAL